MVYVALLRGINVGGKTKVEMPRLKEVFESIGYFHVQTYINTGNVLFSTDKTSFLKEEIEHAIEREFTFFIPVVIQSYRNIQNITNACPISWVNDTEQKTDVMFLWDEVNNNEILNKIIIKPDIDNVLYVYGAILWNIKRENISKSGLLKIVGTELYKKMTVRNVNTLHKLESLMGEIDKSN